MENLESFKVCELNHLELNSIDGGISFKKIKKLIEVLGIAEMAEDFYNGFNEGWDEVRN